MAYMRFCGSSWYIYWASNRGRGNMHHKNSQKLVVWCQCNNDVGYEEKEYSYPEIRKHGIEVIKKDFPYGDEWERVETAIGRWLEDVQSGGKKRGQTKSK